MINEPTEEQIVHWKFAEAFHARRVWLTYVIFGFNILLFALMVLVSTKPAMMLSSGNDSPVLLNFGAKINALILQQTEWFRFVTPIFLHIGILHLAINSYTLWNVGPTIARLKEAASTSPSASRTSPSRKTSWTGWPISVRTARAFEKRSSS